MAQKTPDKYVMLALDCDFEAYEDMVKADRLRGLKKRLETPYCKYGSKTPILAIWQGKTIKVVPASCGMWDCPACGPRLAKKWYGKMVYGALQLAAMGRELSFLTLTCRGADVSVKEAEDTYYQNTNRILSTLRARAKKNKDRLEYVQVTERQKRRHPHSHFIAAGVYLYADTCLLARCPGGAEPNHTRSDGAGECGFNPDLSALAVRAGLGPHARITPVHSPKGATTYIAKYLFKDSMFSEDWPRKWKRVRVSSGWPERPYDKPRIDVIAKAADCEWLNGYQHLEIEPGGKAVRTEVKPAFISCPDDILRQMIEQRLQPGEEFKPAFAIDPATGRAMFIAYLAHDDNICDK